MVRTIIDLGIGVIDYQHFLDLFDNSREFSFQPAEPEGLILWDIIFDNQIKFNDDIKSMDRMKQYFFKKKLKYGFKHQLFNILQESNLG